MPRRVPKGKKGVYILLEEELYKRLIEHIKIFYEGRSTYGLISREIQNAIAHWLNEKEYSAHTKTHINPGIPRIQEKVNQIIKWLKQSGHINEFTISDWRIACMHTVGGDPRTIKKYLDYALKLNRVKNIAFGVYEII
jgi:hypothetical protein